MTPMKLLATRVTRTVVLSILLGALVLGCLDAGERTRPIRRPQVTPLLDDLQKRTFDYFWETPNPVNGLVPDRYPTPSFSSVAAVGFGLTVYPIGAERGYITREQAAKRVLTTLEFFLDAPQGPQSAGTTGYKGFLYHFLDMETGERFENVELSTIDSALFFAGALFCQSYFDRDDPMEAEIRQAAEELYRRADWNWAIVRPPLVSMGWRPEEGFIAHDWQGLNEGMILYVLALGSPTHPIPEDAWTGWTSTYRWADFQGYAHVNFAPHFGHQYSHTWIDFRGIQDAYMRNRGIDYFENSRRATYAQRAYAIENPMGWKGYGENVWGLTACDGPIDGEFEVNGEMRRFHTYAARGAAANDIRDDGTIAPTAAVASLPFAPEIVEPAIEEMRRRYGAKLYSTYGFLDAFNPTFDFPVQTRHGAVDPELGWIDGDYLGIDQGPIVIMLENHRTGLVWETMKTNPHVVRGLRRAGFTGGWLEEGR
jgi:hypothetical protein